MLTSDVNRLALGTVQFGMNYGVANTSGQVKKEDIATIIQLCREAGVDTLDTAIAYGESEKLLGQCDLTGFRVITKIPPVPEEVFHCQTTIHDWLAEQLEASLQRLKLSAVDGLMLHQAMALCNPQIGEELAAALREVKAQGKALKIGVSVYSPDELESIYPMLQPDIIQAPFNILDQRLASSGWLKKLAGNNTEVHVRSVFLQGLLLMEKNQRPEKFQQWDSLWQAWDSWSEESGQSPLVSCLAAVMSHKEIDRVVVGCDSPEQWQEILAAAGQTEAAVPAPIVTDDMRLINPALWSQI